MKKKTAKKPAYRRHMVRNLLLLALVCAICWGVKGYPMDQEAHFRRMERGSLLEPSEIVFARYSERRRMGGGVYNILNDQFDSVVVGVRDDRAVTCMFDAPRFLESDYYRWNPMTVYRRTGDPLLLPLPAWLEYDLGAVAVDLPEGAVSAKLAVELTGEDLVLELEAEGEREGGVFVFRLPVDDSSDLRRNRLKNDFCRSPEDWMWLTEFNYTLTFCDGNGAVVQQTVDQLTTEDLYRWE